MWDSLILQWPVIPILRTYPIQGGNYFRLRRNPFLHMALSHGDRLGTYEVRSRVGASGVGEVHGAKILFETSVVQDASR